MLKYPEIPSKEISKARCHFCLSVEQAGTTNEVEGQGFNSKTEHGKAL